MGYTPNGVRLRLKRTLQQTKGENQMTSTTYEDLKQTLNTIPLARDRVLLKTIYGSCARVGEIVKCRYHNHPNPPITKANLKISPHYLFIELITEKTNRNRTIPISRLAKPEHEFFKKDEAWLTEDIIEYSKIHPGMFPYSTRWAQNIFKKYFNNASIHDLRRWRATHLLSGEATGVPLPERIVAKIGGWLGTAVLTRSYDATIFSDYLGVNALDEVQNL